MKRCRHFIYMGFAAVCLLAGFNSLAADPDYSSLNAKALVVKLPSDIKWKGPGTAGIEQVVVSGDPTKPGLYVVIARWYAHHNSRPHFHPNDRFIAVLQGTWWVNTGRNYDPDGMKPVPAGSVVTHFANEVHYDGAKDEDAIIEIIGMGPATATPAEDKPAENKPAENKK